MKAIKVVGPGKAEIQEVPVPKLRDDYILVKVNAVALNPTDWYGIFREPLSQRLMVLQEAYPQRSDGYTRLHSRQRFRRSRRRGRSQSGEGVEEERSYRWTDTWCQWL